MKTKTKVMIGVGAGVALLLLVRSRSSAISAIAAPPITNAIQSGYQIMQPTKVVR